MATATTAELWDCPIEEYHADGRNSVSHSELECFIEDPGLYHGRYISGIYPREETPALRYGSVFHSVVLGEPFEIDEENYRRSTVAIFRPCGAAPSGKPFYVSKSGSRYWKADTGLIRESDHWGVVGRNYWGFAGEWNGRPVAGFCRWSHFLQQEHFVPIPPDVLSANGARSGKDWKEFAAQHVGKTLLKEKEFAPLAEMIESIQSHEKAAGILSAKGAFEQGIRWTDPETGIVCRCRPDKLTEFCIPDLKSCRSTHPKIFASEAERLGYHRQADWYQTGVEALTGELLPFFFVAVKKTPPYTCEVYELNQSWLDRARRENREALQRLAACRETGDWRTPTHGIIVELEQPAWAAYESQWQLGEAV